MSLMMFVLVLILTKFNIEMPIYPYFGYCVFSHNYLKEEMKISSIYIVNPQLNHISKSQSVLIHVASNRSTLCLDHSSTTHQFLNMKVIRALGHTLIKIKNVYIFSNNFLKLKKKKVECIRENLNLTAITRHNQKKILTSNINKS